MYKKTKHEHHTEFVFKKRPQSVNRTLTYLNAYFTMSGDATQMIRHADYKVSTEEETIKVRKYIMSAFYDEWEPSLSKVDFFGPLGKEKLLEFGLQPCLPDDAPYIRNAFLEQHLGSEVLVVHTPINLGVFGSTNKVFSLKHEKHRGLCIDGYSIAPEQIWKGNSVMVRVIE